MSLLLDLNDLKMKIYEFARILGILLDNAIEAVRKIKEEEKRVISMRVYAKEDLIILQIENTCLEETSVPEDGNLSTTKSDKNYHLIVSLPIGEKPSEEVLIDIEKNLVDKIGLGDHQRISIVHNDTVHFHFHVLINKVHPITNNNIEPYYDKIDFGGCQIEVR